MGVSLQAQNYELSLSVGYRPYQKSGPVCLSPDSRPHIGKKVISNCKFCQEHAFPVTQSWLIMSNMILSHYCNPVISLLTKNAPSFDVALLHPPGVDCPPFPWTLMGSPGDGGKSYPTAKNLLILCTRKIPLNRFTSSLIKSVILSPSNSNLHVITLCKLHL